MADETIEGEETQEGANKGVVELDTDTYDSLLDRLSELEEMATKQQPEPRSTVDQLADEGRNYQQQQTSEITLPTDLDEMSNTQLVQYLVETINAQAGRRLEQTEEQIQTIKVAREIDKAEAKYKDFWTYGNKIKEIALANPALSIERAYHLAKAEMPKQPPTDDQSQRREPTRTEKLLKLPARTYGEKPSIAASSMTDTNRGMSLKSAAERAWEETVGKGKTSV